MFDPRGGLQTHPWIILGETNNLQIRPKLKAKMGTELKQRVETPRDSWRVKNSTGILEQSMFQIIYRTESMVYILTFSNSAVEKLIIFYRQKLSMTSSTVLVLFVRLFDLCLFGFVGFLFLLVSGKGCGLSDTVYERDVINYFRSIKNSNDVLNKFKSKNFQASKFSTYDFSILYTTLPHHLIKDKPIDLINRTFTRENTQYLACNEECVFFFTSDVYNNHNLWLCQKVCDALVYLLDNIFIRYGTKL